MKGARMSALPIARFCGGSVALGEAHGAGRSAALSSAAHAIWAGVDAEELQRRTARLTAEELEEITSWHRPTPWKLADGHVLDYADAKRETTYALTVDGELCEPDHPDCLTVGHSDAEWLHDGCIYLGDIKRSVWTTPDGPRSLQLQAYGYCAALRAGAHSFRCGIWAATEGEWRWDAPVDMHDLEAASLAVTILAAADVDRNEYATGPHCQQCYGRLHCKEYLLPVNDPAAVLAPMAEPGGITSENAYAMLELVQRAEKLVERAKDNLKAFAAQEAIRDGKGKVWRPVRGNDESERFDAARLKLEHPELVAQYTVKGPPRAMGCRWLNETKQ